MRASLCDYMFVLALTFVVQAQNVYSQGRPIEFLKSDNYPFHYHHAVSEFKNTRVTRGRIKLIFEDVQLRLGDVIAVFDGPSCFSPALAVVTTRRLLNVTSTGKYISTLFATSLQTFSGGFHAKVYRNFASLYESPPRPPLSNWWKIRFNGGRSQLKTSKLSKAAPLQLWRLAGPMSHTIRIVVKFIPRKQYNWWLRILDGSECDGKEILYMDAKSLHQRKVVQTSGNTAVLVLFKGHARKQPGEMFRVVYRAVPSRSLRKNRGQRPEQGCPRIENEDRHVTKMVLPNAEPLMCNYVSPNVRKAVHLLKDWQKSIVPSTLLLLFKGPNCLSERLSAIHDGISDELMRTTAANSVLYISGMRPKRDTKLLPSDRALLKNCGQNITADGSYIFTRGISQFPKEILCIWNIVSYTSKLIKLEITSREHSTYRHKWLRIIEGHDCGGKELLYLDDEIAAHPETLVIEGSHAVIIYYQEAITEVPSKMSYIIKYTTA